MISLQFCQCQLHALIMMRVKKHFLFVYVLLLPLCLSLIQLSLYLAAAVCRVAIIKKDQQLFEIAFDHGQLRRNS